MHLGMSTDDVTGRVPEIEVNSDEVDSKSLLYEG